MGHITPSKDLYVIVNRCLTDKEFCTRLLHTPSAVIADFHLSQTEENALRHHHATSLIELVAYLKLAGLLLDNNT